MSSDEECSQNSDSLSKSSSPERKSQKTNQGASPSSISSIGSTSSYVVPTGSPGDRDRYKFYSRDNPSKPREIDFGQPLGQDLNNNSGIASSSNPTNTVPTNQLVAMLKSRVLTTTEIIQMQTIIANSMKKQTESNQQTQTNLTDELDGESQDGKPKYSESQGSDDLYEGPDFFNKTNELNNELDEEIKLEEDNKELDTEINKITKATEKIDDMSVDDLEGLGEDELKKMFNELLQKKKTKKYVIFMKYKKKKLRKKQRTTNKT